MAGFLGDGFVVGVQSGIWWRNCSSLKLELRLMVINFVRFLDGRSPTLLWFPFLPFPHHITSFMSRAITVDNLEPSPITIVAPSFHEEFYNTPYVNVMCARVCLSNLATFPLLPRCGNTGKLRGVPDGFSRSDIKVVANGDAID